LELKVADGNRLEATGARRAFGEGLGGEQRQESLGKKPVCTGASNALGEELEGENNTGVDFPESTEETSVEDKAVRQDEEPSEKSEPTGALVAEGNDDPERAGEVTWVSTCRVGSCDFLSGSKHISGGWSVDGARGRQLGLREIVLNPGPRKSAVKGGLRAATAGKLGETFGDTDRVVRGARSRLEGL